MRERRKLSRVEFERRVELLAPKLPRCVQANSLNLSEDGLRLRSEETLEIRSSVTLRLFAQPRRKPLECLGRVAWVVQRRDLRDAPPFLYDVGVEFVDPPAGLRAIVSKVCLTSKPSPAQQSRMEQVSGRATPPAASQSILVHGRCYEPHVERESPPDNRWHLVVTVDGAPCFSQRYASAREAQRSWEQFRRHLLPAHPRRGRLPRSGKAGKQVLA